MYDPNNPSPPQSNPYPAGTPAPQNPQPNQAYSQQGAQFTPPPNYQYAPQQAQPQAAPSKRTAGIGSSHKDKWVAAILAFCLGTIGIHKFYLGYKTEGIIMIVVSVVGGLCFGVGLLVMAVISIIEAVRYVILTQEEFESTYVYADKAWL